MSERCGQIEAKIDAVASGSIAEEVGLQPGDLLLAVNGVPVADYIAYRFAVADEEITLQIARDDERWEIDIEKDADEDLGITFTEDVFDGVRRCRNKCVFCFEEQMPAGMRASLSLRDDDFRLSFLHGNFITLTNLRDGDVERIVREHLTPLFVSIHTTDPELRRRMMQNRRAPDILAQLRQLADAGIEFHAQIVFCPEWNDGAALERTLAELSGLYPALLSIGIVPVGLTAHRPAGPQVRAVTPADATALLNTVEGWQATMLARHGTRLVYAADEFYLAADYPIPTAEAYEGFPQRENGIGLARLFLDELAAIDLSAPASSSFQRVTIATGTLAAPLLEELAGKLRATGLDIDVVAVPNRFYGGGVSVAGLLTGHDLLQALAGRNLGDAVLLPAAMRNTDGIFLDDTTPEAIARELGVALYFCAGPEDAMQVLRL
ncbi:MAG: DUF512 domain-containing protein [Armatimonadota bacterium]